MCLSKETLAYLMDMDFDLNKFVYGAVEIEMISNYSMPDSVVPGSTIPNDIKVKNIGPNDCYVRVKAVFTDSNMEEICSVNWNTSDWEYNSADRYWYYKSILPVGETTSSLCTTVSVSSSAKADSIKEFEVLRYAEAYQTGSFIFFENQWRKFTGYAEAWEHFKINK